MDTMENKMVIGIDDELEAVMPDMEETKAVMRRPYVAWTVGGKEYKLKLTTSVITKLEQRFGKSLMVAVLDDGIPPLSTVVTVIQASLQRFHHGIKSYDVELMLDEYLDAGGTQISLLKDVVYPLMADAGFFTEAQMKLLTKEMSEADSSL